MPEETRESIEVRNSNEIKWLEPFVKPLMWLYSPIAYAQAVTLGAVVVFTESRLVQLIRKNVNPAMENPDLGNAFQRFCLGYNRILRVYNYRK